MSLLVYALLAGLFYGLYFALVGIGLNLIFGVMRIINLAHGAFLMLGAYGAFYLYTLLGWNPLWAVPIELVVFFLLALPIYYLLVPRLQRSDDPEMLSFILFFGLSQVIEALAVFAFGNDQHSIPDAVFGTRPLHLLGQVFPLSWVVSAGIGLAGIVAIYLYLYRSRIGRATRAIMTDRDEAVVTGISVNRVSVLAFGVGIASAALAGIFSPFMLGAIEPSMGLHITVMAFVIIVIGSLGNPLGTVLGGLIFGEALMLMQTFLTSWAQLFPYVLLIAILLVKPSGLLGRKVRSA
ncbi:branched-chain amino acid ABC transporter permease [Oleiagrimonas sp.]|jgi:branched-chain amino acid transport system permease protein|uniref:branched-chain amino acid ABC transporter permease n=1 Tax=Oleiagrimonas sp. TaxID=2010330 RepID=UPI00262A0AF3|nr:branched-chain amino acid ABC transporter permease [Oleiagrimonas sp.]MDA3912984.1 branched-chain amino acid ABC transporter permease [Oleiagrimonas sp.]